MAHQNGLNKQFKGEMKNTSFNKMLIICITSALVWFILLTSCQKNSNPGSSHFKCVTCANGGVCRNDTCRCNSGFEGITCETETRQKFMGTWNVTEEIGFDTVHYSIDIQNDTSFTYVQISNLDNGVFFSRVRASVSGDTLTIPMQYINGQMVVGKGYFLQQLVGQSIEIIMRYAIKDTTTGSITDFGYYFATNGPSIWIAPVLL